MSISMKKKDKTKRERSAPTVCFTISVPSDMLAIIDAICEKDNVKRSTAIQGLIQRGFAHMKIMRYQKYPTYEDLQKIIEMLAGQTEKTQQKVA